ncbi:MAG: hypothetical protein ACYS8Z_20670, partial [Planctomycetota bacterium]
AEDSEKDTKDETELSKELVEKASALGFSDEEIEKFEDDAELEKFVDTIESVMSEEDEDSASAQAESKDKAKDTKDETLVKFENEDDIDPELLGGIRALEKDNKELRETLEGLVGRLNKQQQDQFIKRFDGMVKDLGKDYVDTFGVGSYNDLGKRSRAYRNRQAVGRRMNAFAQGMVDNGLEVPSEKEMFDLAVNSLHKNKVETVKGLRLGKKTAARSKQRIGRPATRKTGKLTGQQKAVETSRAFDEMMDTTED